MARTHFLFLAVALSALFALSLATGCTREYSMEGRDTTSRRQDTLVAPGNTGTTNPVGNCARCTNELEEGKWSFTYQNTLYCGIIDTAIRSPTQEGFTFYGPSLCSTDSGLVVTVRMSPDKLTRNYSNYTFARANMYYYDHVGNKYMLESSSSQPFRLVIANYNHQTKEISGTFSGTVYTADGREVNLQDGRWKTFLR